MEMDKQNTMGLEETQLIMKYGFSAAMRQNLRRNQEIPYLVMHLINRVKEGGYDLEGKTVSIIIA